jgi:hypothetical protein
MMCVIVDEYSGPALDRNLSQDLKATANTLEARQTIPDWLVANPYLVGNRDRSQGIQDIVLTRQCQINRQCVATGQMRIEGHTWTLLDNIRGTIFGASNCSISDYRLIQPRPEPSNHWIIDTQNCQAVER